MKHFLPFDQFTVLHEAYSPAETKAKLSIKKDSISDEDFDKIYQTGVDRAFLPGLCHYVAAKNEIDTVVYYAKTLVNKGLKINPGKFQTFIDFTHAVDAAVDAHETNRAVKGFNIESTPADYSSKDGRYLIYDAKSKLDCIRFGKGFPFCISRPQSGNMYYSYRMTAQSKFYFVFDTQLDPQDNTYITVVDAHPKMGKKRTVYEFTHHNNNTAKTTNEYGGSLDTFIASKPGLEEHKHVFVAVPTTEEERSEYMRWNDIRSMGGFSQLTYDEKRKYIQSGNHSLRYAEYEALPMDLKSDYLSFLLEISETSVKHMHPSLLKTWFRSHAQNNCYLSTEYFKALPSIDFKRKAIDDGITNLYWGIVREQEPEVMVHWFTHLIKRNAQPGQGSQTSYLTMIVPKEMALLSPELINEWMLALCQFKLKLTDEQYEALGDEQRMTAIAKRLVLATAVADKSEAFQQRLLDQCRAYNQTLQLSFYVRLPMYMKKIAIAERLMDPVNILYFTDYAEDPERRLLLDADLVEDANSGFIDLSLEWKYEFINKKKVGTIPANTANMLMPGSKLMDALLAADQFKVAENDHHLLRPEIQAALPVN